MVTTVRRGRGRPPRSEDSRQDEILRAALRAFAQGGYEGTNLRRIAADADVDVALIAHHFGSKLGLWKAAVDSLAVRRLTAGEGGLVSSEGPISPIGYVSPCAAYLESTATCPNSACS